MFHVQIFELATRRSLFSVAPEPQLSLDTVEYMLHRMLVVTGETFSEEQLYHGLYSSFIFDEIGEFSYSPRCIFDFVSDTSTYSLQPA